MTSVASRSGASTSGKNVVLSFLANGKGPPSLAVRGRSASSAYLGGRRRENAVLVIPQVGLFRLLQDPSRVRYLYTGSQTGAAMKQVSEILRGKTAFVEKKSKDLEIIVVNNFNYS